VLGGAWAVLALRRVERERPQLRRPEPVGERS
jgi:hypothetical protein